MEHQTETQQRQRVESLIGELNQAYGAMITASTVMSSARTLFSNYKGWLNEQQFTQRLEAASSDPAKAGDLITQQDDKRLSFESARLALQLSLTELFHKRDQFARTVMKCKAWVPHIKHVSLKRRLAGTCVQQLLNAHAFNEEVMDSFAREPDSLPSGPRGVKNLERAFEEWRKQDWKVVETNIDASGQSSLQRSYTIGDRRQAENSHEPQELALIPLHIGGARMQQYKDMVAALINRADQALSCTGRAKQWQAPADFASALSSHIGLKCGLNEAQYTHRLSEAIAEGKTTLVGQLKEQQQQKRLQLSSVRATISHYMSENLVHASELAKLASALANKLEADTAAGVYLEADLIAALKNNVLAGHRTALYVFDYVERVNKDLKTSDYVEELAGNALLESLNSLTNKGPYRSLEWTVYKDGTMTEPL